jgi:hypothetical protein
VNSPLILVVAGGTGGHLFPAEALAVALGQRGVTVDLATDERATRYGGKFPARATHVVPSETFRSRNPFAVARTCAILGLGLAKAWRLLGTLRPAAVVGFGGYPTIPPVLAATLRGIPSLIHEQNAVMGRANRLLAPRVTAIAASFSGIADADQRLAAKTTLTGNPVRPAVVAASTKPYPPLDPAGPLRLVVFGGSQGGSIRRSARGSRLSSRPATRTSIACARAMRASPWPPRCCRSSPTCLTASPPPTWSCRAPAPRQSPSSRRSVVPPSWCRCRTRSTRTSLPMPSC